MLRFPTLLMLIFGAVEAFTRPAIDERQQLEIGGIRQAIWVKGNDVNKPLLLFLHGGPGNSVMPYAKRFCDQLYDHFVVVHWDQREVGETLRLNPSQKPLTLDLFQQDTQELIDTLLARFHRKKLYLAGHSWGTALGFHIVRTSPSKLEAFIAIGSMVHQVESEKIALDIMQKKALDTRNLEAQRDLAKVKIPFETGEQLFYHRKYLLEYMGSKTNLSKAFVTDWAANWLHVFNEASRENWLVTMPEVQCPVYFFAGRNDYQTNSSLVEQYYRQLKAPAKDFFWFEKAGHSIPSAFGSEMQRVIIEKILKVK